MTAPINIEIASNAPKLVSSLSALPPQISGNIAQALDRQNELTVGYIQATRLSSRGPRTLGVVTNRLRSSIRPSAAVVDGNAVSSSIGSNVAYAGVHEFGFDGEVDVASFTRRNPRGNIFSSSGSSVFNSSTGRISKGKKPQKIASGFSIVKAHQRHMHLPERAYIRSSIDDRKRIYGIAVADAIISAWEAMGGRS